MGSGAEEGAGGKRKRKGRGIEDGEADVGARFGVVASCSMCVGLHDRKIMGDGVKRQATRVGEF